MFREACGDGFFQFSDFEFGLFEDEEESAGFRGFKGFATFLCLDTECVPIGSFVEGGDLFLDFRSGVGAIGENLCKAVPIDCGFFGAVFFHDHVEVAAAESKCTDCGASRVKGIADPGARGGVNVERCCSGGDCIGGFFDFDGWGEYFVMESECGFDESGRTGGGFRVADLGFYGAKRTPGRFPVAVFAVDFGECGGFNGVAFHGSGAVCFEEFDGIGRNACVGVCCFERFFLAG